MSRWSAPAPAPRVFPNGIVGDVALVLPASLQAFGPVLEALVPLLRSELAVGPVPDGWVDEESRALLLFGSSSVVALARELLADRFGEAVLVGPAEPVGASPWC